MVDIAHYAPLFPEALLTLLAVLIVLLGALIKKGGAKITGYLSLLGLVAALGLVSSTIMISKPALFFFDTISVDGLSQFFKAVFIVVSLLVVIASLSRYINVPGGDEFYALLLMATVGMMVVSSSVDLVTLFVGFELASLSTYGLLRSISPRRTSKPR